MPVLMGTGDISWPMGTAGYSTIEFCFNGSWIFLFCLFFFCGLFASVYIMNNQQLFD